MSATIAERKEGERGRDGTVRNFSQTPRKAPKHHVQTLIQAKECVFIYLFISREGVTQKVDSPNLRGNQDMRVLSLSDKDG